MFTVLSVCSFVAIRVIDVSVSFVFSITSDRVSGSCIRVRVVLTLVRGVAIAIVKGVLMLGRAKDWCRMCRVCFLGLAFVLFVIDALGAAASCRLSSDVECVSIVLLFLSR